MSAKFHPRLHLTSTDLGSSHALPSPLCRSRFCSVGGQKLASDSRSPPNVAWTLLIAAGSATHGCLPIVTPKAPHLTRDPATIGFPGPRRILSYSHPILVKNQKVVKGRNAALVPKAKMPRLLAGAFSETDCYKDQLAWRRRNAGISRWSSTPAGPAAAGRPCWSRPCGAGRRPYSDTGSVMFAGFGR